MGKAEYVKPSMKVVELVKLPQLLTGSNYANGGFDSYTINYQEWD